MGDKAGWEILSRTVANALRPRVDVGAEKVRDGSMGPPDTPATLQGDEGSVVDSVATSTAVDRASRDEKDKERWARLKRIKQAFRIKRVGKGKGKDKNNEGVAGVVKV